MNTVSLIDDGVRDPFLFRNRNETSLRALLVEILPIAFGKACSKINERQMFRKWLFAMPAFETSTGQDQVNMLTEAGKISYAKGLL